LIAIVLLDVNKSAFIVGNITWKCSSKQR